MDLSLFITGILGIIVVYFLYWLVKMPNDYFEKCGIPIVKSPPIVGIMWKVILRKKGLRDVLTDIYTKSHGQKLVGFNQFLTPTILICDADLVYQVLVKDFAHFEDRGLPMKGGDDLFCTGLNMLTGDEWRNARHKLVPAYTSGKLKKMFEPIKECSDELVNYIDGKPGEVFEAKGLLLKCAINVIGSVGFGVKMNVFNEKDKQSAEFFEKCSTFLKPSLFVFAKLLIAMSNPKIQELLKFKILDADVEDFFRRINHDIIKEREKSNTKRNDFLQIMLDEKKKELNKELNSDMCFDETESCDEEDKELMEQLKSTRKGSNGTSNSETFTENFISSQTCLFITAGSDTIATVLCFVLYQLAVNPDLQKKVQDEISHVLSSQEFGYEAIKKLTYTEQFIYESMRLRPTAIMERVCTRDYKVPGTEITIPKGTFINFPVEGFHMDPQYFPDPEKFDPDRFKDMDSIPKGAYFSFGSGPRICIAMRLAMLEINIILTTLLSNYTIILSEKTKLPLKMVREAIFPQAEGGIWIEFKRR